MMGLPTIDAPVFNTVLPATKTKITYRPFTVKEEKILLVAQQSADPIHTALSVLQVIKNCVQGDIDVEDLPSAEVDLIFIKLRAISVNNIVKFKIRDKEDETLYYDSEINLDEVTLTISEEFDDNEIELSEQYKILLKCPTYRDINTIPKDVTAGDLASGVFGACIDKIFTADGSVVHVFSDYTMEQQQEWIETLPGSVFTKIKKYMNALPVLEHEARYVDSKDKEQTQTLRGLSDFFYFA